MPLALSPHKREARTSVRHWNLFRVPRNIGAGGKPVTPGCVQGAQAHKVPVLQCCCLSCEGWEDRTLFLFIHMFHTCKMQFWEVAFLEFLLAEPI